MDKVKSINQYRLTPGFGGLTLCHMQLRSAALHALTRINIFIFINIHLKAEKAGGPEGGRAHQQRKKNKKPQAENHG